MPSDKFLILAGSSRLGNALIVDRKIEYYADLMHAGLRILVNDDNDGSELVDNLLMALTEEYDTTFEEIFQLAEIFATLMWEYSKCPPRIEEILSIDGWSPAIIETFLQVHEENASKIENFRLNFLNKPSYFDMSWRLDIEVASRNVRNIIEPTYMIRLDVLNLNNGSNENNNNYTHQMREDSSNENRDGRSTSDELHGENVIEFTTDVHENISSVHLQSDFANLKNVETEIQLALNSLKQVNSQNLADFIM